MSNQNALFPSKKDRKQKEKDAKKLSQIQETGTQDRLTSTTS